MKINNEYINTKEYTENFFIDQMVVQEETDKVFKRGLECVTMQKGEDYEAMDGYTKFGSHIDDYDRMKKWGLAPADEDEVTVTVQERIQIQLMTYCEDYNGTGLNIDKAKMEKVLGSSCMAEAVSKASSIEKFNDYTKEYMLKNAMEPTVDNVYMAVHSSSKKEIVGVNDPSMLTAISDKLVKEGYEANDANMANAKWLVDRGIELSNESMSRLNELNQLTELSKGDEAAVEIMSRNIAFSIYNGKSSNDAYLTDRYVNTSDIEEAVDAINQATEEDVVYISVKEMMLNVQNLRIARAADKSLIREEDRNTAKSIAFKQTIFEARIVMTQSSVYNLKKLGLDINYAKISDMTEEIIAHRQQTIDMLVNEENQAIDGRENTVLMNTFNMMSTFSFLPNAVIGKVYSEEISFTVESIHTSGMQLKTQYEAAMMTYETLGTEVRRDLGDSYKKAFSNVDNLLASIGMEVNAVNQRAVRILGYNSMEITIENVVGVRELAADLDYLIDNLNPKTAMHLIKNGINPLLDNIKDVNAMLEDINSKIGTSDEKMGQFLWNLEKKGLVTDKEKEDYIELYRIMHMISKNDGNVIGRVLSEGRECTLKNLYSAYKSKKAGALDHSLSDEKAVTYVKRSLTTFMDRNADVAALMSDGEIVDISLEKMLETDVEQNIKDTSYYEEIMRRYESIETLTEGDIENMSRQLQTGSIEDIATYMNITNAKSFMKKVNEYEKISEAVKNIELAIEEDGDTESLNEAYEILSKASEDSFENIKEKNGLSYEKFNSAYMMNKVINFMSSSSKKNSYFIPMQLGEEMANIHLTIHKNDQAMQNVSISMSTDALGSIRATFRITKAVVEGDITIDNRAMLETMNASISIFAGHLNGYGMELGDINLSDNESATYDMAEEEALPVNTYYNVAKAFIRTIKSVAEVK